MARPRSGSCAPATGRGQQNMTAGRWPLKESTWSTAAGPAHRSAHNGFTAWDTPSCSSLTPLGNPPGGRAATRGRRGGGAVAGLDVYGATAAHRPVLACGRGAVPPPAGGGLEPQQCIDAVLATPQAQWRIAELTPRPSLVGSTLDGLVRAGFDPALVRECLWRVATSRNSRGWFKGTSPRR